MRRILTVLITAGLTCSLAPAQQTEKQAKDAAKAQAAEPAPVSKVFSHSRVRVWKALMGAVVAQDLFPQGSDEMNGTMSLHDQGVETVRWGSANGAVAKLTTKKVSRASAWQLLNVFGSIECVEAPAGGTEVRVALWFKGSNAVSSNWERLASSGVLEAEILKATEARLNAGAPKSPAGKTP